MDDIRSYLVKKLSFKEMYSVEDLFKVVAEYANTNFENAILIGYSIEDIQKLVADEYLNEGIFKHRRKNSILQNSSNTYLMNNIFIIDLLDEVENRIELNDGSFYSLTEILRRFQYPVNLDRYYSDDPWSNFDKTYIQKIVKNDYEGVEEYPKTYEGWIIYGPDEKFKDSIGKHEINSNDFEPRPEGYKEPKAGVLEYLVNKEYAKNLAYELEEKKYRGKHELSINKIRMSLANMQKDKIGDFSEEFLEKKRSFYLNEIQKLDVDKSNRTDKYQIMIQNIEYCIECGYFDFFDELTNLKENIEYMNSIKVFNISYQTVLKKIIEKAEDKYLSDLECYQLIAKSLYYRQNKYEKDFIKYRKKVFEAIGNCAKTERNILLSLKVIKQRLVGGQLSTFDLLFGNEIDLI